jgi:transketolase N-terminal domain/subunit
MSRSLLDGADLAAMRALLESEWSAAATGLIDSGLLQFDPADPAWEDRDRLIVADAAVTQTFRARLHAAGAAPDDVATFVPSGGTAMGLAFGAALASDLDGNAWRPWAVLDERCCDDGRVWEVARAAADAATGALGVIV